MANSDEENEMEALAEDLLHTLDTSLNVLFRKWQALRNQVDDIQELCDRWHDKATDLEQANEDITACQLRECLEAVEAILAPKTPVETA